MKSFSLVSGVILGVFAVFSAWADEIPLAPPPPPPAIPLVSTETAWVAPGADGQGERLVPGARPDDAADLLVSGRFRYQGLSPAAGLRIELAVPAGMRYAAGSAVGPGAEISVSVDGGRNFLVPDAVSEAGEAVSHIRWDLPGTHPPGTAGLVSFRARPPEPPEEPPEQSP